MLLEKLQPWLLELKVAFGLVLVGGSFYAGWHECGVRAERDQAKTEAAQAATKAQASAQLAEQERAALQAATDYANKAAALRTQFQVIHDKAAPILVTLASCPLPADTLGVLDAAAQWADRSDSAGSAIPRTDGPGTAPGEKPPDGR